ncbi:hypothetical protein FACS189419_07510 [Planctomycetales bacterium]|nr:hypothetical protein FACS189419_07510 [Planctomycetales bacterium]
MGFNFFDWVRNEVKDSVLLGVSDAVNTIGMPHDASTKEKILPFLQNPALTSDSPVPETRRISNSSTGSRKLGRGLGDLQPAREAS